MLVTKMLREEREYLRKIWKKSMKRRRNSTHLFLGLAQIGR
jgi:hypothetical protein